MIENAYEERPCKKTNCKGIVADSILLASFMKLKWLHVSKILLQCKKTE